MDVIDRYDMYLEMNRFGFNIALFYVLECLYNSRKFDFKLLFEKVTIVVLAVVIYNVLLKSITEKKLRRYKNDFVNKYTSEVVDKLNK